MKHMEDSVKAKRDNEGSLIGKINPNELIDNVINFFAQFCTASNKPNVFDLTSVDIAAHPKAFYRGQ
jgi:hypothetical protein